MKTILIQNDTSLVKSPLDKKLIPVYQKHNAVKTVDTQWQDDKFHITGKIAFFQNEETCDVYMNTDGEISSISCTCGKCDDTSACVHFGALLATAYEQHINTAPIHFENEKAIEKEKKREQMRDVRELRRLDEEVANSRALMEHAKKDYTNRINSILQEDCYEITASIEYRYAQPLRITYRVGKDKFYIIKNIQEFIDRVEQGDEFSYGKKLSFIHKIEAFDEDAQRQINYLQQECLFEKTKKLSDYEYFYETSEVGRFLEVEPERMDAFFDTYFELEGENFVCTESDKLQHIIVKETKNTYDYSWEITEDYIAGNAHLYAIEGENSYHITRYVLDEKGKTRFFLQQLHQQPMRVLKSENQEFTKYVLSDIMQYLDIDTISQAAAPLDLIKLYGDIDESGQIFVKLVYYNEDGKHQKGFDEEYTTTYAQDVVENIVKKYAQVIDYGSHIAYFDSEGEDVYNFIYNGLPLLSEYCEVYVSEALKRVGSTQKYTITVGVHLSNHLLEIDVDSLEIPKEELSEVLRAYKKKRKFFRLKNGKLLNLNSDDLQELDSFMEDYHLSPANLDRSIQLPSFRMLELEEDREGRKNLVFERNQQFKEKVENWHQKDIASFSVPDTYCHILRDYQKEGYGWLHLLKDYGFDGILADDMGLGKTLQVIALLESLKGEGTSIVVCPASLIYNWDDEIKKFSSNLKTCCVVGNALDRSALIHAYHTYDLLVTSYDYMRRDVEAYETAEFLYVVLDEAQNIKNQKTKNAISVKKLKAKHRLALTGTPIENSLAELWSIFDFLMPNYLYNYHYFQSHYENDIIKNNDEQKQSQLKRLVAPFILRRTKKEVLKELPEKIEKNYLIDFNEEEQKLYLAHLAQVNDELKALTKMEGNDKIMILAMLTRLRQLCCEPRLLFENVIEPSSKLCACMELIKTLRDNKQKVILFSSFTSMLDLIGEELYKEGITYYVLSGKTSKEDRRELVSKFQKDDTSVFLISLKAGGTGLNLTAAEAVIHYDPWWNQSAQNQATDRAHRIGQKKTVQVFKLIMKSSIEEKIQKLQMMKKELADMFVENNEGSISRMSKEELMELFKM